MFARLRRALCHPGHIGRSLMYRIRRLGLRQVEKEGRLFHQYRGELYPDYLNHGNARQFIAETALPYCQGKGIDVGADRWPLAGTIPIRNEPDVNAYKLDCFEDGSLDFVFSSHCLEHLEKWQDALCLWIRKLKPGGVLFLYLPHESMKLWNPGGPWVGYLHKWKPRHEILIPFLKDHGLEIIDFNPGRDHYWSFHVVGRRTPAEPGVAAGGTCLESG